MNGHLPVQLPGALRAAAASGPLLRVVVGSRLHGFAGPGSDYDSWVVVAEPRDRSATCAAPKVFQGLDRCEDGTVLDVTVVGVSTFLRMCAHGSPQALEALFAPAPVVDTFGVFRHAYRVSPATATASYRRLLRQLVAGGAASAKERRHGFRLALNLNTLRVHGRFNPVLSPDQREWVLAQAADPNRFADRLATLTGLSLT